MYFSMKVYPIHISKQKFDNCVDLLLINNENKPQYVYIKDLNRFVFNKKKHKNEKKYFCRYCLQYFKSGKVLQEHKEISSEINDKQSVKL